MMDALTFLKKRRDYCNSHSDCTKCIMPGCATTTMNDTEYEIQVKFIESLYTEPLKCPTCGHDVRMVAGKYAPVEHGIDAEKIANIAFHNRVEVNMNFKDSVISAVDEVLNGK